MIFDLDELHRLIIMDAANAERRDQLDREIAEDEKKLEVKKAEYAKLTGFSRGIASDAENYVLNYIQKYRESLE